MNENFVNLKTPDELESEAYPDNVQLGCHYSEHDDEFNDDDDLQWVTSDDEFMYKAEDRSYWPCSILDRFSDGPDGIYSVEIFQSPSTPDTKWTKLGAHRIIERFPRQSIRFFPQSGSSDHYLTGVFRQPLGLPHNMMVEQWVLMK